MSINKYYLVTILITELHMWLYMFVKFAIYIYATIKYKYKLQYNGIIKIKQVKVIRTKISRIRYLANTYLVINLYLKRLLKII